MQHGLQIVVDDLMHPGVHALLQEHLAGMRANSPVDGVYALDLAALRAPEITFWTAWDGDALLGCGALKALDAQHGEVKSMRTASAHLRKGVAAQILAVLLQEAQRRGYRRLSLETGSSAAFLPAIAMYERHGFSRCGAFGAYVDNAFSVFMTRVV